MRLLPVTLCFTASVLASPPLQAVKLYKLTYADGTVRYQTDSPSPGTGARVEVKDIDPDANVVPIEQFPLDGNYTSVGDARPPGPPPDDDAGGAAAARESRTGDSVPLPAPTDTGTSPPAANTRRGPR